MTPDDNYLSKSFFSVAKVSSIFCYIFSSTIGFKRYCACNSSSELFKLSLNYSIFSNNVSGKLAVFSMSTQANLILDFRSILSLESSNCLTNSANVGNNFESALYNLAYVALNEAKFVFNEMT